MSVRLDHFSERRITSCDADGKEKHQLKNIRKITISVSNTLIRTVYYKKDTSDDGQSKNVLAMNSRLRVQTV